MGLNNNKKSDRVDDVIVSVKSTTEADRREVFFDRTTGKLSYKRQDRSVAQIENEPATAKAYKSVLLSLNQTGIDAPTAVVLSNDTGIEPTLTRSPFEFTPGDFPGNYRVVMPGAFANKLVRVILPVDSQGTSGIITNVYAGGKYDDDSIYLVTGRTANTIDTSGPTAVVFDSVDGALFEGYSFLEIQIWDIPE